MHQTFMRRALELASQARGKTGINPMVGAVLVREGNIIAEGFHEEFGKPHAERQLLEKFAQKISSNDILYISLEPCCHQNKKTPPCAQFLIERGVKTVVYGMKDPNPHVAGKGIELLINNGVQVFGPVLEQECRRLNRGYISVMTKKRPWITLKSAVTLDGKYAKADGSPLKITSQQQDAWSHEFLRARHDAILVGIGTILKDNPRLDVRVKSLTPALATRSRHPSPDGRGDGGEGPWRIILDAHLQTPLRATIVGDQAAKRTIILHGDISSDAEETYRVLEGRGVRLVKVSLLNNVFDWTELWEQLMKPDGDFHGISSILVEGGAKTWQVFRASKMVDEEVTLIGG